MAINAASLIMNVSADTSAAERSLSNLQSKASSSFNAIASGAQSAGSSIGSMFDVAGGMAAAQMFNSAVGAVKNFAQEAQSAYAFSERLGMSLQTMASKEMIDAGMAGSMTELRQMPELMGQAAGRAKELQDWMEKLAIQSPFRYEDVADAMRLSMAYGFTSTQAQRLTKTMSDFTAGTGQSGVAIKRMTLALGQIQARGKVATQEINQLSEVGVNARGILAKAFNKTTPEIIEMIEKGLVPADKAIEAIVSSLENDFGSAAESQAESMSGMTASLEDLQSLTARDLFSGIFKSISPFMAQLIATLTDPKVKDQIKQIGVDIGVYVSGALAIASKAVTDFHTAFVAAGGGVIGVIDGIGKALNVPEWVAGVGAFVTSWAVLTPVIAGVGRMVLTLAPKIGMAIAALTSPIGLVAAAIVALGLAWTTNFMGIQEAMAPVITLIGNIAAAIGMVYSMISSGAYTEDQLKFLSEAFGGDTAKQILVFADNVRTAMLQVMDFVTQMTSATGPIQSAWNDFSATVVGAWNQVVAVFTKVSAAISGFMDSGTWSSLTTVAGAAALFISNAFKGLFSGEMSLTEFTGKLGVALTSLARMIQSAIASPDFAALSGGLASALGLENLSLDGVRDAIMGMLGGIGALFSNIDWGAIIGDVSGALQIVAAGIMGLIAAIDWGAAMEAQGDMWGGLIGGVVAGITSIDWGAALTNAATIFGTLISAIVTGVQTIDWGGALTAVGSWYQGFIDGLVSSLGEIDWGTNLSTASTWLDGVTTWVSEAFGAVDWGTILTDAATFTGGIVSWVATAITGLDWGAGLNAAAVTMGGLSSAAIDAIGKIDWGAALTAYGTLWGNLVGGLIAAIANIDWSGGGEEGGFSFTGMVAAIIQKITDIDWGAALAAGASFYTGLVTAITGQLNGIDWGGKLQAGAEGAKGIGATIAEKMQAMEDEAMTNMAAVVEGMDLTEIITNLLDSLTTALTTTDFTKVGSGIGDAFNNAFAVAGSIDLTKSVGLFKTSVQTSWDGVTWDSANTSFDNLKATIKTAWDGIDWTTVGASMDKLKTALGNAIGDIGAGFKTTFEGSAAALTWSEFLGGFTWDTYVTVLAWPESIFKFDWATWISGLTWPTAIAEFDWTKWINPLDWGVPVFPGWESIAAGLGFGGGGGGGDSSKDYGGSPYGTEKQGWNPLDIFHASGTDSFAGGPTWVGEKGPEIVNLPRGTQIFNNRDSIRLAEALAAANQLPGNAAGTTGLPPLPPMKSLRLGASATPKAPMGPQLNPAAITGPITKAGTEAMYNISDAGTDFLGQSGAFATSATTAMEGAADATATAFKKTADQFKNDLKGALQSTPGLFGKSQVTEDQMKLAKLGVPQNFADDWLRQLTDEVVNGVDWANVDIKDAAARAGIDPNLPKDIILQMVTSMWEDSSLFADPKNLDLINMKAVGDTIAKQQAAASGQANIMAMFGLGPDGAEKQAADAANAMMSNFAATLQGGTMTQIGQDTMTQLASGMGAVTPETTAALTTAMSTQMATVSDMGTAQIADSFATSVGEAISTSVGQSGVTSDFIESIGTEMKSETAQSYLATVGAAIAEYVFVGYKKAASEMPWADAIPPAGNAGQSGTPTAPATGTTGLPGNASGTSFWRGGYTIVGERGPELVRLPSASRIWSNQDTQGMLGGANAGGDVVIENVNIHNGMDVAELEYRIRQVQRRRGR